ncbi:MAG TPA: hypothetical protein VGK00_04015 [Anaerolineales bacterium]|jgi:hypothetical protein
MKQLSNLFILWALQGIAALAWLASLPTDAGNTLLGGFSAARLALMGALVLLSLASAALYFLQRRYKPFNPAKLYQPLFLPAILITLAAPALVIILLALGSSYGNIYHAYAARLAPLLCWLALSALELAIFLAAGHRGKLVALPDAGRFWRYAGFSALALALLAGFIAVTRLGTTRYNDGSWGEPTTPLLEWQILLALAASMVFIALETRWKWFQKDRNVFFGIYALTCLVWLSTPLKPGYFATPPRAPNFEIYPFSDALIYAQYAQSALAGNGFLWPEVPTRPLYIAFLTWLHALAGQDYTRVIILQTLVLAAFPALLYLLGRELSGRPLGVGLALLAIFRDLTANVAAPFALNYTYTKLYFSEIPAALLVTIFTLLAIRWVRQPKPAWYALLAGGLLGLSALIRLQSVVVLAAVIPLGFLVMKDRKKWLLGSVLVVFGVVLALSPWLARNYRATGGLVLDNPISQSMVLARRWGGDSGNALIPRLPGEGDAQYSSRMGRLALASLRENPLRILGSAANHFLNNEIGNLLVFPLRDKLDGPSELIWPSRAFWQTWNGQPSAGQALLIFFYACLLALGLAAALHKNGLVGVLPLALSLVYNAWTALFLSSGDRFLVPVDWGVYFYLFLGLLTLAGLVLRGYLPEKYFSPFHFKVPKKQAVPFPWRKTLLVAAFILLCGASLPLTELAFPKRYNPSSLPVALQQEITLSGRAIYPRWYAAGEGEPGSAKLGYGASDQARLVFFLVGEKNSLVLFPMETAPKFFPNTAEVNLTATQQDGFLLARKISIQQDGNSAQYPAR